MRVRRSLNARVIIAFNLISTCKLVNVLIHIHYQLHLVTRSRAIAENRLIALKTIMIEIISAYREPLTVDTIPCSSSSYEVKSMSQQLH